MFLSAAALRAEVHAPVSSGSLPPHLAGLSLQLHHQPLMPACHFGEFVQEDRLTHAPETREKNTAVAGDIGFCSRYQQVKSVDFLLPPDQSGRFDAGPWREGIEGGSIF